MGCLDVQADQLSRLSGPVQSKRGGRVQLHTLLQPQTDYSNGEKGEVRTATPTYRPATSASRTGAADVPTAAMHVSRAPSMSRARSHGTRFYQSNSAPCIARRI